VEKYEIKEFPSSRQSTFDAGYIGMRKHHVKALIELDVTHARKAIRNLRYQKKDISFNAWMIKCIGQAINEYKDIHAIRKGKNKLVIFDDVDVSIIVEKKVMNERVPLPVVIRKINKKTIEDIYNEIKLAKNQEVMSEKDYLLGENKFKWAMKIYVSLPQFIRVFIWKHIILKKPFLMKIMAGTAVITSVGTLGKVRGWAIPVSPLPVCFALGSIVKKPGIFKERIEIREFLYMTILIDHDVIDGAPAARFVSRLAKLVETGYGL